MYKKMNLPVWAIVYVFVFLSATGTKIKAAESGDLSVGTVSYLSYETNLDSEKGLQGGEFKINRTYLTIKKQIFKQLGFRLTLDAYQDDKGNMNTKLKYAYGYFSLPDIGFITKSGIEFGMIHTPFLDWEQNTNLYRMQGKMFIDRNNLNSSADLGVLVDGYLGGEMNDEYKKKVNKKYAGRYGSFQLGVFNGGGYDAKEVVQNKALAGRISLRPLPDVIPGLQFTYFGNFGEGNKSYGTDSVPAMQLNTAALSYEHQYFTIIGQYIIQGKGNRKGTLVQNTYEATPIGGYSAFLEIKPIENWKAIFRYDSFDENTNLDNKESQTIIAGVGYNFGGNNVLILDYDKTMYKDDEIKDIDLIKLTMQICF